MHQDREDQAAIRLDGGEVLVTGGNKTDGPQDHYNSTKAAFTAIDQLHQTRSRHRMVLLNSNWGKLQNRVLVIGGSTHGSGIFGGLFQAIDSVEIYNPSTRQFEKFGTMTEARWGHTATQLSDGRILIAGGTGAVTVSGTAEEVAP
jgi:N-acetylneuraminic acid mutarotase